MRTMIANRRSAAESMGTRVQRAEEASSTESRIKAWFPASPRAIATNYAAGAALILLGYALYAIVPRATEMTRAYYDGVFPPESWAAFRGVLAVYLLLLPVYYATFPDSHTVKCRRFWQGLFALTHRRPTHDEAVAFRAVAVKAIFWPVMVVCFLSQAQALATNAEAFLSFRRFFPYGYCAIYHGLFVVDVMIFGIGYGVEHPWLRNEIRSVEPTLLGWFAALLCYPPLVWLSSNALMWFSLELPLFRSLMFQVAVAVTMLLCIGIYVWASLSLGLRASNLTNRGIVTTGPYRWMRHPAYTAKNVSWWLGATPLLIRYACSDPWCLVPVLVGTAGWSGIYVLRAFTEERHLGSDPDYQVYRSRVRWRFFPGLL